MTKRKRKTKNGYTCKIFWQGSAYAMALPTQLVRALEISEGDKLAVYLDNGDLVVEKFTEDGTYPKGVMFVVARVIGAGAGKDKMHKQIGFTVPRPIAEEIKKSTFKFPVIEKKEGDYFKLVFKNLNPTTTKSLS